MSYNSILLHVPHSSLFIPESFGVNISERIRFEILSQSDLYVDDIFNSGVILPNISKLVFNHNRFYCDVERYWLDEAEPMSKIGQGVFYTHLSNGSPIDRKDIKDDIKKIYDEHHLKLNNLSENLVNKYKNCLIVDCHSFNDGKTLPDFCIGLNDDNTRPNVNFVNNVISFLTKNEYSVDVNNPYIGSIYPSEYKSENLNTLMIEINKRCYLDNNFKKITSKYNRIKHLLNDLVFHMMNNY